MNKKANIILAMLLAVVGVFSLTSCKDDEPTVAKAVLCSVFSLDFDANGGSQEVKVVSDAMWHVEAPDWITVSPETGEGTTFVTITAKSNYEGTEMNARRNADVIFKGNTKESEAVVVVRQDGDGYKGVVPCTGAEFYTKANEAVVIVKDMTVVATYAGGIIATDGASNVYAVIADKPAVGSTVSIYGSRDTDKYGMAYIVAEKTEAGGSASVPPAAVDITADIDAYKPAQLTHVTLSGLYDANAITVADKTNKGFVVAAADGIDMKAFASHNVTVDAYCLGTAAPAVNLIVTGVTDNGIAEVVFFSEDFEWLEPWSCQKPAGQTVEANDEKATAQQLGTNKVDDVSTYDALVAKGYSFPICCNAARSPREAKAQTYLQRNYIKFGLTGYYSGITFPAMTGIPEGANTVIAFDWCSMRHEDGKWDDTQLVVLVKNGTEVKEFLVPTHEYVENEAYAWLPVRIDVGDAVKNGSEITIRNIDSQWPSDGNGALRWFLDNFKIVEK